MKTSNGSPRRRSPRSDAARRAQLLAEFDRGGLSAAAFTRQHGLNYTTFCGWRQRRDKTQMSPAFVQVEVTPPAAPDELVIELGAHARMRLASENQVALAVRLLRGLNAAAAC
jgi:transposase-like protein